MESFFAKTFQLGMQDIGGIFILHGMFLAVAVGISLFQFYYFETSKKSLSEVFFVRQARREIRSMRESMRNSLTSDRNPDPTTIVPSSPSKKQRKSRSNSLVNPFGSHDLTLDESSSMMEMSHRSGGISVQLSPVLEGDREESLQFGSSSLTLDDKKNASLRASALRVP